MNKLSKRSVDKILLFLNNKDFNYVTLSKREVKILFYIYQNATSEIFELEQEKDNLHHQLEEKDKVIDKVSSRLKLLGKYDGETCTRNFKMMSADFNQLLEMLERGKNNVKD